MNTQVHDTTGRLPYELVFGQMPREVVFLSSKKSAIFLEEDLEADGVVLDSVDCHNSAITTKSTNDSEEPCQEGNLCIGQIPDVSKCDDDSAGDRARVHVFKRMMMTSVMKPVVLRMILETLVEIQIVMGNCGCRWRA